MRFRITSPLVCGILMLAVMTSNTAARTSTAPTPSPVAVVASYFAIIGVVMIYPRIRTVRNNKNVFIKS